MTTKRMKEIQIKANEIRSGCKVIKYGILNIFSECDRLGYRYVRYPIGADGILGFAQMKESDRIIFSNSFVRLSREIFTVAHEIGHMQLHIQGETFSFVDDNDTVRDYDENDKEAE